MNNEAYAEWLVKRKAPAYTYAIKGVMIFLCVIGAFLALTTVWGILILTAIGAATFFVFQGTNLEFEYLVVNDQLTIDKIMGKARRKKAWEGTMEEVQIVAPSDSYMLKDYERAGMKTLDFSSQCTCAKMDDQLLLFHGRYSFHCSSASCGCVTKRNLSGFFSYCV